MTILVSADGSDDSFKAARFDIDIPRLKNVKAVAVYAIRALAHLLYGDELGITIIPGLDEDKNAGTHYVEEVRSMW
jgi:hypothetical protein